REKKIKIYRKSRFAGQDESNDNSHDDSQIHEVDRADSLEDSASDERISENNQNKNNKKRKKLKKTKKTVGRPEDPVNNEYIKLSTRDKYGHVAMKYRYCENVTPRGQPSDMKSHLILE
ncbi:6871_t:CDS:2, partial [Racocetra fulgida]